ncbi:MAG: SH3 domain-containing protein [Leptolyngbya sp. SIO3F4]|nr:SH3 domain-containing protein [Leptolyngbya sp. SIO3F4]
MASNRFNPQDFLIGLIKFIFGVAIALLIISLAGAATARYFLTQLSTLPERPFYDNDSPVEAVSSSSEISVEEAKKAAEPQTELATASTASESEAVEAVAAQSETKALYQVLVTYGAGLLVRTGAGVEYETIDGIDYDETVEVLEESGRWYRVRTNRGVEGWIKGPGNTQRL